MNRPINSLNSATGVIGPRTGRGYVSTPHAREGVGVQRGRRCYISCVYKGGQPILGPIFKKVVMLVNILVLVLFLDLLFE